MTTSAVRRISIFSAWLGFANPCSRAAMIHFIARNGVLVDSDSKGAATPLPSHAVLRVLAAIQQEPIQALKVECLGLDRWLIGAAPAALAARCGTSPKADVDRQVEEGMANLRQYPDLAARVIQDLLTSPDPWDRRTVPRAELLRFHAPVLPALG
jgi:hypothetical protein